MTFKSRDVFKSSDIVLHIMIFQAPESMKAVIMAIYLLTDAFGNAITLFLTWVLDFIFDDDELVRKPLFNH